MQILLKFICQILAQSDKADRLFCKAILSSLLYLVLKITQSSANNPNFYDVMFLFISFMYKKNIRGPSTVAWDTSEVTET